MSPERRINPLSTDVMSVAEAARRTQLSEPTIRKGIDRGEFPGSRVSGRYVIPRAWFTRWLNGDWQPVKERETA